MVMAVELVGGPGGPVLFFCRGGGGGGVKNIIEALTFWERIPTDPLTRTGLSTLQLSRPSVILTVLSSHFQIRSKGADVNDTNIQKPSYA